MSQPNRVQTMAEKVAVYARRGGVDDVATVLAAYQLAMQPRLALLSDVFHYDMLHPARTTLILLEQAGMTSASVLAAGALTESLYPELHVASAALHDFVREDVIVLRDSVPMPLEGGEMLLERLVTAAAEAALIAVAERLDHARHLHFRKPAEWPAFYREATAVYIPVAARVSGALADRFDRWAWAFQKRLA